MCSPYLVCDLDVYILFARLCVTKPWLSHTICRYSSVPNIGPCSDSPNPEIPQNNFQEIDEHYVAPYFVPPVREPPEKRWTSTTSPPQRDGHPLRRPTSSHRSGSPGKEMDIHYVAHFFPPVRKPPEREGHPLRRLLTPRPPPPFDFGQSDRVREPDPEIAPKFAVPAPLLRS